MRTLATLTIAIMIATTGCSSTYDSRYAYDTTPDVRYQGDPSAPFRTLVSVVGVFEGTDDGPGGVEMRLRVENQAPVEATFVTASLSLVSADLQEFPAADTSPAGDVVIMPQSSETLDVFFPFPAGHDQSTLDLSTLFVRWDLRSAGQVIQASADVERRRRIHRGYDRYPHGHWGGYYGHHHSHGGVSIGW